MALHAVDPSPGIWKGDYTLTASDAFVLFSGTVKVNLAGPATLTKASDGTVTLDGPKLYTGVSNIEGGSLVFGYTSGDDPAATICSEFTASYDTGGASHWDTGQFLCTTADNTHTLGWADDPGDSTLTVMYTLIGDANLDGGVDIDNLTIVLASPADPSPTGITSSQGDFYYQGTVNESDISAVLNQMSPAPDWNIALEAPEATSICPLGQTTTNGTTLQYLVAFSQGVKNVVVGNFSVTSPATVANVVGYGSASYPEAYLVTVNVPASAGTLSTYALNLWSTTGIVNVGGKTLGSAHSFERPVFGVFGDSRPEPGGRGAAGPWLGGRRPGHRKQRRGRSPPFRPTAT